MFLASKTCYWEQSWRLLRNRLWNMIWGVDHSTLQTKSSSFFFIRGNPVLTTGSSSLRPVLWKWHEQKFMCRNNISKLTLFKKVRLITPKLQVRLITPPDATWHKFPNPGGASSTKKCSISNPGGTILTKKSPTSNSGGRILIKYVLFTTQGAQF